MSKTKMVFGLFRDPDAAAACVRSLTKATGAEIRCAAPAPYPLVERTRWRTAELLPWIALGGAIVGCLTGAWLQRAASLRMPFIVGGKPIIAWVAFGVIMFEMTMLVAGLCTFMAMVVLASVGRRRIPAKVVAELARGISVVMIPTDALSAQDAKRALTEAGADEVKL